MKLLKETIFGSIPAAAGVLFVLMLLNFGYAQAFHLAFGSQIDGLQTFPRALLHTTYGIFEDLDGTSHLEQMHGIKRLEAHMLYISYAVIMGIFSMGVIIAIIDDVYTATKANMDQAAEMRPTGTLMQVGTILIPHPGHRR